MRSSLNYCSECEIFLGPDDFDGICGECELLFCEECGEKVPHRPFEIC